MPIGLMNRTRQVKEYKSSGMTFSVENKDAVKFEEKTENSDK
jgi:hypothetical protein